MGPRTILLWSLVGCGGSNVACGVGTHLEGEACVPDEPTASTVTQTSPPTGTTGPGTDTPTAPSTVTDTGAGGATGGTSEATGGTGGTTGAGSGSTGAGSGGTTDTGTPTASWDVCAVGAPYVDIQDAVDAAVDGDVIRICAGVYPEVVVSQVDVELRGEDRATTIIDGGAFFPAVSVANATVTLAELTLTGQTTVHGGVGALVATLGAEVSATGVNLTGQQSGSAYAYTVLATDSDLVLDDVLVSGNASGGVALEVVGGSITLLHTTWRDNSVALLWNLHADVDAWNNLVYGNTIAGNGVVAEFNDVAGSHAQFVSNNTFADNVASTTAVILTGAPFFQNNILADNTSATGLSATSASLDYNNVSGHADNYGPGTIAGPGGMELLPFFVDAPAGDYTLDPLFSPCVDAGDPLPGYNDPDGSRNDLGAFGGPSGAWTPR